MEAGRRFVETGLLVMRVFEARSCRFLTMIAWHVVGGGRELGGILPGPHAGILENEDFLHTKSGTGNVIW